MPVYAEEAVGIEAVGKFVQSVWQYVTLIRSHDGFGDTIRDIEVLYLVDRQRQQFVALVGNEEVCLVVSVLLQGIYQRREGVLWSGV